MLTKIFHFAPNLSLECLDLSVDNLGKLVQVI